jgi:hypothetical protein
VTSGPAARDQGPGPELRRAAPARWCCLQRRSGGRGRGSLSQRDPRCPRQRVARSVAGSGLDADPSSPFCYAVSYGYTEQPLAESGCPVSIDRASIYSEFFLGLLARSRTSGQLRLPAVDGRISLVSRADVELCLAPLVAWPGAMSHVPLQPARGSRQRQAHPGAVQRFQPGNGHGCLSYDIHAMFAAHRCASARG